MSTEALTPLLTVQDVADKLGVSTASVRRYIRNGDLAAVRLGGRAGASVRVPADALDEFVTDVSAPPPERSSVVRPGGGALRPNETSTEGD